jgi:predicted Zn-dependent peptidase
MHVVRLPMPHARSCAAALAVRAGSRYERDGEQGTAYLLNRVRARCAFDEDSLAAVMRHGERIGAQMTSGVNRELTMLQIAVRADRAHDGIDLLAAFSRTPSRFEDRCVEQEARLLRSEGLLDRQRPSGLLAATLQSATFGDGALGRPMTPHAVDLSTQVTALDAFRTRTWNSSTSVLTLAGNLSEVPDDDALREMFSVGLGHGRTEPPPRATFQGDVVRRRFDGQQTHLGYAYWLATPVPARRRIRASVAVLSGLLGGSGGSRLRTEIRERRGVSYAIATAAEFGSDFAVLRIRASVESSRASHTSTRVKEVVQRLRGDAIAVGDVARAKSYVAGRLVRALETPLAAAAGAAQEQAILAGSDGPLRPADIDATTVADVRAAAELLGGAQPAEVTVGPDGVP